MKNALEVLLAARLVVGLMINDPYQNMFPAVSILTSRDPTQDWST